MNNNIKIKAEKILEKTNTIIKDSILVKNENITKIENLSNKINILENEIIMLKKKSIEDMRYNCCF